MCHPQVVENLSRIGGKQNRAKERWNPFGKPRKDRIGPNYPRQVIHGARDVGNFVGESGNPVIPSPYCIILFSFSFFKKKKIQTEIGDE